jgi:Putative transposase
VAAASGRRLQLERRRDARLLQLGRGYAAAFLSFPFARVVYAKRPFAGPQAVLAYLARYTHRVAISNSRLVALDEKGVTFKWKIPWGGG